MKEAGLPDDLIDFVLESGESVEEVNNDDWRFGNEDEESVELLKHKKYSENTAKKLLYVLKLWSEWVVEKNKRLSLSTKKVPTASFEQLTVAEICE